MDGEHSRHAWITLGLAGVIASCGGAKPPSSDGGGGSDGISSITLDGGADATAGDDDADGSAEQGGTGPKLDVDNADGTGGAGDCMGGGGGMMGGNDFSIIWISNSPAGHVSKIDTKTGVELGRYYTGPTNGQDDPSRTSVNLQGDVAVTNRAGGITKFASEVERCIDQNGNGQIETSTGPNDVRPFGTDECMLWHVQLPYPDMDNTQGPRPTAWDTGSGMNPCEISDDRVWVGWWFRSMNTATFHRLDGATGNLLDEVVKPNWDVTLSKTYGPYGGAVDGEGNFWVTGLAGPLVKIDAITLELTQWEVPPESAPYGTTVDANGHPWSASLNGDFLHFDPDTQQFDVYPAPNGQVLRGLMIDRNGYAWAAGNSPCALVQFDTATRTYANPNVPLPGCGTPVGVSIDVDGFVWVPDQGANLAFKVDPVSFATTTTGGLIQPYTYSDMTGAGLGLVVNPPTG